MNQTTRIGTFFIDDQELALDVHRIEEIVGFPTEIARMPRSEPYVCGVFNLRGSVIPVVDASSLLGIGAAPPDKSSKIAIISNGQSKVGLVFQKTGDILSLGDDEIRWADKTTTKTSFISGVASLQDGKRLIEILDAASIFAISGLPRLEEQDPQAQKQKASRLRRQCIGFEVSGQRMGLDIAALSEIVPLADFSETVLVTDYCLGVMSLRGDNVPIINFAKFLACAEAPPTEKVDAKVLIVLVDGSKLGLLIDRVFGIETYYEDQLLKMPLLNSNPAGFRIFAGVLELKQRDDLHILNGEELFKQPELLEICRGYSNIYSAKKNDGVDQFKSVRRYYLLFKLHETLAIPIGDVHEIILRPPDLSSPPGLPNYVQGLYNLRGEMVTVLNSRSIYGLAPSLSVDDSRILILQHDGAKYGIVVDEVSSIVLVEEGRKMVLPSMLLSRKDGSVFNDLKEYIEVEDVASSSKMNLAVMDFYQTIRRLQAPVRNLEAS